MTDLISVDFGTTNSCVSMFDKYTKTVKVIPSPDGNYTIPTCIYFDQETADILVGQSAYDLSIRNQQVISNFKRLVGITYDQYCNNTELLNFYSAKSINVVDLHGYCAINVTYNKQITTFAISDLIQIFIKYLIGIATDSLNNQIKDVVITVPAYFTDNQRQIVKSACESLNLHVLRIINEPTSAALAYAIQQESSNQEEYIVVVDCGGGTTDFSLLYMDYEEQVYEVRAVYGDNFLGGEDLTDTLSRFVTQQTRICEPTSKQLNKIRCASEHCKKSLSYKSNSTLYIESLQEDNDFTLNISNAQFRELTESFWNKITFGLNSITQNVIVNKFILVGGTTRIPEFTNIIRQQFGNDVAICNSLDPDQTISIGGAIQGALLKNIIKGDFSESLLIDIIPLSIGVETRGGLMNVIISKHTPLPVSKTSIFSNSESFIDTLTINIYQGERKFVADNECLASFCLQGLDDSLEMGKMKIKITYDVSADGIFTASAEEMTSGTSNKVSIVVQKINPTTRQNKFDVSDFDIIEESERSNKLLAKLEFHDTFKQLLSVFHEHRHQANLSNWQLDELNNYFNSAFDVISSYTSFTKQQIQDAHQKFINDWHMVMFSDIQGNKMSTSIE